MEQSVGEIVRLALFGIVGLITIVAAGAFSKRLGIAAPLILIVAGVGFSFIPGAPVDIPHELVLVGLLPPILYASALNVPIVDFRRNFTSISVLSVGLVVATAFLSGWVLFLIFDGLSFPAALAIGAVISPTDAVAATAIAKKLGLPHRLVTILEGESLVNDATALVLLRSAIAAVAAATTFWGSVGDFFFDVLTAIAVGFAVGIVAVFIRSRLKDPVLDTAVSFAVPFVAYLPAEALGASGVIAVVVAGLYSGHRSAAAFSARSRISERLNWRTVQFVLENGVFLLIGIQVTFLVGQVRGEDLSALQAVLIGLLMTLVVLVIRFVFVGPLVTFLRSQDARADERTSRIADMLAGLRLRQGTRRTEQRPQTARRTERAERMLRRRQADIKQLKAEGLDWRGGVVLGWSGMRGVVTLAAAQTLPNDTPFRPQLVLIAFTVAVTTLIVQGGTLPLLIRTIGIRGTGRAAESRELAELLDELGAAGIVALDGAELRQSEVDPEVLERARAETLMSAEVAREHARDLGADEPSPQRQYRALRWEALQAQRDALLEARAEGGYSSRVLDRAQSMLDLEETRLEQLDDPGGS